MSITAYFFSGWIENLGVVPLFLLAAFLLAPLFFALFFRIASVCFVLDAISYLFSKASKMLHFALFVKAISLCHGAAYNPSQGPNIYLARGEQKILAIKGVTQFSVGNSEVLGRKYSPKKERIYLKGKKLGFSDLIIWTRSGKQRFNVYVLSKRENLKLAQIAQSLEGMGLSMELKGKRVLVTGLIDSKESLKNLLTIKKDFEGSMLLQLQYSKDVLRNIISNIYLKVFQQGYSSYQCFLSEKLPSCEYSGLHKNKDLEKEVLSDWNIPLSFIKDSRQSGNLNLKFKLLQVEFSNGEELSLGLQQLSNTVANYLNQGPQSLYESNTIKANGHKYQLKLLAEPQIKTVIGKKGKLHVGLEIPYQSYTKDGLHTSTNWKETGLKINYLLKAKDNNIFLEYKAELSSPGQQQIKSSYQESTLLIKKLFHNYSAFHVIIESKEKFHQVPLGFKDIPILGSLLSSHQHNKTYKLIMGFIQVFNNE